MKPYLLIGVLMLLPSLVACGPSTYRWQEELRLHDGQRVVAERIDVKGGAMEPGWTSSPPKERRIQFSDPRKPDRSFELSNPGGASYLLADVVQGVAWVLVAPGTGDAATALRCSNGYVVFRGTGGDQWARVSLTELPPEIQRLNMTAYINVEQRELKFVTADDIDRANDAASKSYIRTHLWSLRKETYDGRSTDCFSKQAKG